MRTHLSENVRGTNLRDIKSGGVMSRGRPTAVAYKAVQHDKDYFCVCDY